MIFVQSFSIFLCKNTVSVIFDYCDKIGFLAEFVLFARKNLFLFIFHRANLFFSGETVFWWCLICFAFKMALLYTENKSNANASAIKTPFLIEDILDRSTAKAAATNNLFPMKKHSLDHHNGDIQNFNGNRSTNGSSNESALNIDKNGKHNSELSASESEFRRITQNDRYVWSFDNPFLLNNGKSL